MTDRQEQRLEDFRNAAPGPIPAATLDDETRIFTVWGPTAEWGDGSGPLYVTDSMKSAGSFVRWERNQTCEMVGDTPEEYFTSDPDTAETFAIFRAAAHGSRAEYQAAAYLAGWPTRYVGYWVECSTLAEYAGRSGLELDSYTDLDDFLAEANER